jgi:hypothetical protein
MVIGEGNVVALVVVRKEGFGNVRFRPTSDRGPVLSQMVAAYVTRGTVTPARIEGSFGRFGSVAVRFQPVQAVKQDPRRCLGHSRYTVRYGTFAGHIRFAGEGDYVTVRAHRARGHVRTPLHLRCRGRRSPGSWSRDHATGGPSNRDLALLDAEDRSPTASTSILAFQIRKLALLLALREESKGRMAEVRYAVAILPASILSHDDALTSATLTPPRPFDGKGIYTAAPDGTTTWTGSLSVAFPGAPKQPLTGAEFAAQLEVGF